jgi:hypothetical protein
LSDWRVTLSKGPNRVAAIFFLPRDRKRSSFQNVFLKKRWTMDEVHEHDSFNSIEVC